MDLLERIDHWAGVSPDAPAHVSDERSLTYGELRRRSDALASYLTQSFGDVFSPIAALGHREPEMLIAFLGAVKSGRPYVPIDTAFPQQRIEKILAISRASLVLTPDKIAQFSASDARAPSKRVQRDDPFYILFTSGSTGEPKGVVITLGCLEHFIAWMLAEQKFLELGEIFLNQAPFSFDLSVMDLYCSLAAGGTLFSISRDLVANPKMLYRALANSDVTTWVSTPSFAQMCLVEEKFDQVMLPRVRRFLFCGETLAPQIAARLLERFPSAEVWNTYGPTETTVATTSVRIDHAILEKYSPLPIGRPMPGSEVSVVDENGQALPANTRGEIIIAGPNVSPGYLGRPDLTANAFFQHRGQPAYRTGDLGRFRDNLLFFEGRIDEQIKLYGYRIELGDVEANLRALTPVRDTVVIPVVKDGAAQSLAAFVVLNERDDASHSKLANMLRRQLGERLPAYMVPRKFVFLDAFPMTANGKVDRARLAESLRIPYADFTYFALLLYAVVPTLILGLFGRAGWRWALLVTAAMFVLQYHGLLNIRPHFTVREIWIALGFALWQWATILVFARAGARGGWPFYVAIAVSLLPLAAAKLFPVVSPGSQFGFLGISYITFRALDVVFCLRDKVIATPGALDFLLFLFFFPTISAGPIDRYRRFTNDWKRTRTRAEFLSDLDGAVHRIFRGFFYKFIIAALIKKYWLEPAASGENFSALLSYMYAYSFYLFFDFAGYSAFAIALSYLFGVHTPENFRQPFLARNIRDFWNRWHITLSFWFRDHVYMRFVLAAMRGKWFASKHTAAILGYFLAFGLMGLWHGIEPHYIVYGLYQATLLSVFHLFSEWNKKRHYWPDGAFSRILAVFLTFHLVCFGLLIFSGRIGAAPLPHYLSKVDLADCSKISGWVWDKYRPNAQINVDLWDGEQFLMTFPANLPRFDLVEAGYGNGRHAFRISTPLRLKDGYSHVIHLRVSGAKKNLPDTERVIVCR